MLAALRSLIFMPVFYVGSDSYYRSSLCCRIFLAQNHLLHGAILEPISLSLCARLILGIKRRNQRR